MPVERGQPKRSLEVDDWVGQPERSVAEDNRNPLVNAPVSQGGRCYRIVEAGQPDCGGQPRPGWSVALDDWGGQPKRSGAEDYRTRRSMQSQQSMLF